MKQTAFFPIALVLAFAAFMHPASAQWYNGTGTNTYLLPPYINVGIGTTGPTQKLHIKGGNILLDATDVAASTGNIFLGGLTYSGGNTANGMRLSYNTGASTNNGYIDVRTTAATDGLVFRADIGTAPGTERMRICANGNVGIGAVPGAYRLYVSGNTYVSGTLTVASDRRFKDNIQPIQSALDMVKRLQGVQYGYRKDAFEGYNFPEGKTDGFIAQNVREVLPELVQEGTDGYLAVNYNGIIPVLAEAIKEMNAEKDAKIAALEARLAKLEAALVAQQTTNSGK